MADSGDDDQGGKFKSVGPDIVPTSKDGRALVDLYVYLPSSKKYVKWLHKGDRVNPEHVHKIKNHVDPKFYHEKGAELFVIDTKDTTEDHGDRTFKADPVDPRDDERKVFAGEQETYESARLVNAPGEKKAKEPEEFIVIQRNAHLDSIKNLFGSTKAESLVEPIDGQLKEAFAEISDSAPGSLSLKDSKFEALSEKLCSVVAPEVGDVRSHLRNVPAFVGIMDDSAAISTLAILFAVAQGQKSRGVFKDLSYACLLMDLSLLGITDEKKREWIVSPETLSEDERLWMEGHPRRSQAIVMEKFKNLQEIVGQMILGHHELFNGRGFPRKIRSDLLPPVVRILAFAVDVHMHMKRAEFLGEDVEVAKIIESFIDPKTEPHLRRHNIELCRKILKYSVDGDPEE